MIDKTRLHKPVKSVYFTLDDRHDKEKVTDLLTEVLMAVNYWQQETILLRKQVEKYQRELEYKKTGHIDLPGGLSGSSL